MKTMLVSSTSTLPPTLPTITNQESGGLADIIRLHFQRLIGVSVFLFSMIFLGNHATAGEPTYLEKDGLVIMEMENTKSSFDQWVEKTSINGYTGRGYLEFSGNNPLNGSAKSPQEFNFKVNQPGLYYLHLHCARETLVINGETRTDVANDAFVRVEGDYTAGPNVGNKHGDDAPLTALKSNTKFFGGNHNQFVWASGNRLDLGGTNNKRVAVYNFKAGETYKLVVSGRSQKFKVNRIVFRHSSIATNTAQTISKPESGLIAGSGGIEGEVVGGGSGEVDGDGSVTISGELKQWHRVDLKQIAKFSSEMATPNPFRDYRMNVTFTAPSGKEYLVPGYFAADGNGGDSGNVWMAHLNPHETGMWQYSVSFRSGDAVAASLDDFAGSGLAPFDGSSGTFIINGSDKTGNDFRASDKGMLINRGDHYLTYGGSGKPFLYTGPGIPENILGYNGFTNSNVGIGHDFNAHLTHWKNGDPDWDNGAGKKLIGALNYIADQGGNSLYMMSNTIGGDGKDVFPHPTTDTTRDRYDLLKLKQWDIALAHAQKKGIFLHWHLAETELSNALYYGGINNNPTKPHLALNLKSTMTVERKIHIRMLNAVFGHYNALKWNLMEECELATEERTAQMDYIKAIDPYDHPVTYQVGGSGIAYDTYNDHLSDPNIDSGSFQGSQSRTSIYGAIQTWRNRSAAAGNPWTCAWDEPQKIENDNTDEVNGYPMGRREKMWPCLMGGGDGFMWYIQQDGGGHGFDQRIEDFTIMQKAFNWSGHVRNFLGNLPLTEMTSSTSIVKSDTGDDYALVKAGEIYAIYNDRVGTGMTLNLTGVTGTFTVKWFDPRNGGALQNGTVQTIEGGAIRSIGSAPNTTNQDWAILVQAQSTKKIAYIHGDVASNGTVPSGTAAPFHQMLLTDSGNRGLSIFKSMVEAEGHTIQQFYDQNTTLNATFLNQFDVIIFSLHQKIWTAAEKAALDTWLRAGGGMLIYSDSASGGLHSIVGAQNPVGQTVTNNLISQYGMQVTVDQANGVKAVRAGSNSTHPIVSDRIVLEGEGVSPVAVDPNSGVIRLIPYENNPEYIVSGAPTINHTQNITIQNPKYAALALAEVGNGNIIAMFDRQPMWNNGEGSHINKRDNKEMLRRIINFLAESDTPPPAGNIIPVVSFLRPNVDGLQFPVGSSIAVEALASDADGSIAKVDLYINGALVRTENAAPYNWSGDRDPLLANLTAGIHTLVLIATDNEGAQSIPAQRTITVVVDNTYILSVTNGSGSGEYAQGQVVPISASAAPAGQVFDTWIGDTTFVADVNSASTTVTMPAALVSVLATYRDLDEPNEPGAVIAAINAGGPAYTAADGTVFSADTNFSGGRTFKTKDAIAGTQDETLYKTERFGNVTYSIPVANGDYQVTLKMAEIYQTAADKRLFDVSIEGVQVIDDLDLFAEVGHDAAYDLTFSTTVTDGELTIAMVTVKDNAKISAILVRSAGTSLVNNPPVAYDDSVSTDVDVAVEIKLKSMDADGDVFTYNIVDQPENGVLIGIAPDLTYIPNAGFFGNDSFTFETFDGIDESNLATVSITVNQAPAQVVRYEAEDAVLSGPVFKNGNNGFSGDGYADYQKATGDYVEWTVSSASARDAQIIFGYALRAGNRPLEIQVNGNVVAASLSFPSTGSWSDWGTTTALTIPLKAGTNKIRATAITNSGANVDYLEVSDTQTP